MDDQNVIIVAATLALGGGIAIWYCSPPRLRQVIMIAYGLLVTAILAALSRRRARPFERMPPPPPTSDATKKTHILIDKMTETTNEKLETIENEMADVEPSDDELDPRLAAYLRGEIARDEAEHGE